MLSNTEREYLLGNYSPSNTHKRFLNHKIRKKLKEFYQIELPLIQNSSVNDFTNVVSEFTNAEIRNRDSKDEESLIYEGKRRTRSDLNRRPNAPQAFALSKLCNESSKGTVYQIFKNVWY